MPCSSRLATPSALLFTLAAVAAGAKCPIYAPHVYVGATVSLTACDYDDIQTAITSVTAGSACPVIIDITPAHEWQSQHLTIDNRTLSLVGWGAGVTCSSLRNFCSPVTGCTQTATQPVLTIDARDSQGNSTPGSVLAITGNSRVNLYNLTITGGDTAYDGSGGGIDFVGSGILSLVASTVANNYAGYGGGINVTGSGGNATLNLYSIR